MRKTKLIFKKITNEMKKIFSSYKKSFWFLVGIYFIILFIFILVPACFNTFYSCNSDDVVQYYSYVINFFDKIKSGDLSLYDTTLFGGTSYFASVYYIPIGIFLIIAFLLSFVFGTIYSYFISLLLEIFCGGLLLFYVFKRKNVRPKVLVVISIIYVMTGLTQSYMIFPVYLGIIFYVPLSMLLIDLFIEKKNKTLIYTALPIYVFLLVLFDYYVAYMLLAFMMVYFLLANHLNLNRFFLFSKTFYLRLFKFILLIVLGLALSACILIPSALYVINETSRTSSTYDYFWFFSSDTSTYSTVSFRHYFTQLCNLFIPNNPYALCIISTGDYVREQASLYMTSGGLIFFIYFFFMRGKENNRLKLWVILFNIMFCIPLFSMIFTFNNNAYVRWFFIPYMINFYAMTKAMDKTNFMLTKNKISNLLPIEGLIFGFCLIMYVFIENPDYFIHYSSTSSDPAEYYYFYAILIGTLIFLFIYILLLVLPHIFKLFKKNIDYIQKAIPFFVLVEVIFSVLIIVSNIGSTDYISTYNTASSQVKYLKNNLDYDSTDGYRINLYTEDKFQINSNILYQNVNCTNFFQSFYNTPLNIYYSDIHEQTSTSWTRRSMYGYSLLNAPMFNNKYVITENSSYTSSILGTTTTINPLYLPSRYYSSNVNESSDTLYYTLDDLPNFTVYDSLYYKGAIYTGSNNSFYNDLSLLKYGYVNIPTSLYYLDFDPTDIDALVSNYDSYASSLDDDDLEYVDNLIKMYNAGLSFQTADSVYDEIDALEDHSFDVTKFTTATYNSTSGYYEYNLSSLSNSKYSNMFDMDSFYVYAYNSYLAKKSTGDYDLMYLEDDDGNLYPLHYNVFYNQDDDITYTKLLVKRTSTSSSKVLKVFGYDFDLYDDYIDQQNEYTNREFSLNGSKMHVAFTSDGSPKVIKTAYTYSSDWYIKDNTEGYETVNIDGGFLGIIVPSGVTDVDVNLKFSPNGLSEGLTISTIGVIIYISACALLFVYEVRKRSRREL